MQHVIALRWAVPVVALVFALAGAPAPARAQSPGSEYGNGAVCALANVLYGPVKLLYATGGALIAGAAYAFSGGDAEVARPIVDAALRGDYVITPDHLRRRQPLEFVGRSPEQRRMRDAAGGQRRDGPVEEGF